MLDKQWTRLQYLRNAWAHFKARVRRHPRLTRFTLGGVALATILHIGGVYRDEVVFRWAKVLLTDGVPWLIRQPVGLALAGLLLVVAVLTAMSLLAVRPLHPDVAAIQAERDSLRAALLDLKWRHEWGMSPPDVLPLSAVDEAEVTREGSRIATSAIALHGALQRVQAELTNGLAQEGESSPLYWAGVALREQTFQPTLRNLALLCKPNDQNFRRAFRAFIENYQQFVERAGTAARLQGRALHGFDAYDDWSAAHREFLAEIGRFPNTPPFAELRHIVYSTRESAQLRPLPSGLSIAAAELGTANEEAFLALFCLDHVPEFSEGFPSLLSKNTYAGGKSLVQRKLLTVANAGTLTERFTLGAELRAVWAKSGREKPPLRTSLDVPLSRVEGTGASGSGARG